MEICVEIKIYKIESKKGDKVYIGATRQTLSKRFNDHKQDYKKWKNGVSYKCSTSSDLFDLYGVENCFITLLEAWPYSTDEKQNDKEARYIRTNNSINKIMPDRKLKFTECKIKLKITIFFI